jgi:hypothetical protein
MSKESESTAAAGALGRRFDDNTVGFDWLRRVVNCDPAPQTGASRNRDRLKKGHIEPIFLLAYEYFIRGEVQC